VHVRVTDKIKKVRNKITKREDIVTNVLKKSDRINTLIIIQDLIETCTCSSTCNNFVKIVDRNSH